MTRKLLIAMASLTGVVALAACGGGSSGKPSATAAATTTIDRAALAKDCPVATFTAAPKPLRIKYWHALSNANEDALKKLTAEFNGSQSDVQVTLQNQGGTDDNLTKFKTVAGSPDSPDLIQLGEVTLQRMVDARPVVPVQACIDSTHADTSDILPRVRNYYTESGAMWAMPFNVSQPVLLYNKAAFRKAGLDPEAPPTSFEELQSIATQLHQAGYQHGFEYKRDSWVLEQFLALAGEPYVNNGNGRTRRATAARFNTPTARKIFAALDKLVASGVATSTPNDGPSAFDNLLSICNGTNAMTFDTSAVLGTAYGALNGGQCKAKVDVGVAPLPLPNGPGKGGTLVGGAANYIARDIGPAKVVAAWKFAQYLASADAQATFAAATGYIPISKSATTSQAMLDVWKAKPGYKVAYDQLASGVENVATAGPAIGDYGGVRKAMSAALESFLVGTTSPDAALNKAVQDADAVLKAYNDSIG